MTKHDQNFAEKNGYTQFHTCCLIGGLYFKQVIVILV